MLLLSHTVPAIGLPALKGGDFFPPFLLLLFFFLSPIRGRAKGHGEAAREAGGSGPAAHLVFSPQSTLTKLRSSRFGWLLFLEAGVSGGPKGFRLRTEPPPRNGGVGAGRSPFRGVGAGLPSEHPSRGKAAPWQPQGL